MRPTTEYVARATARIVEVLEAEHAVVSPELESRIAEAEYRDSPNNIDPHHITTALTNLTSAGLVTSDREQTRGGRVVTTIRLAGVARRATKVALATRRKRLLHGRYQGWSQGTQRHPHGTVGPAGEAAVRQAILDSNALQPAALGAGPVTELLGTRLPGELDSAGFLVPLAYGVPSPPITLLFEVKNVRSWIYPSAGELFQVPHKGVVLQQAHPDLPILPLLVCRREHKTTYYMAKQLGFAVIAMDTQFAGPVEEHKLDEIRNELHFTDLRLGHGPSLRVRDRLRAPGFVAAIPTMAEHWAKTVDNTQMADLITRARRESSGAKRRDLVDELRVAAKDAGLLGGW